MNIDVLIQIAGVTDFASNGNQMGKRLGNGLRGLSAAKIPTSKAKLFRRY